MKQENQSYIQKMRESYKKYGDNDSLLALVELETQDERARELRIYREQEKTQELIRAALSRYKICLDKLTHPDAQKMTDTERTYCFASMEWCKFTLDIVGENPDQVEKMVDQMVEAYAKKVGIV